MWRRYLCWVQYRGEAFSGWQAQPGSLSAHSALSDGLAKVFGCGGFTKPVVASRTDAGVHAVANVVHFDARARSKPGQPSSSPMSAQRVAAALNAVTARTTPGISVVGAAAVPRAVSARFDAIGKTYVYRMLAPVVPFGGKPQRPPALADGKAWCLPGPVDVAAMKEAAAAFQGHHNFSRLRVSGCTARTADRTVFSCSLEASTVPTFGPEPWAGGTDALLPWGMAGMGEAPDGLCLPGKRLSAHEIQGGANLVAASVARMARLDRTGAGSDAAGLLTQTPAALGRGIRGSGEHGEGEAVDLPRAAGQQHPWAHERLNGDGSTVAPGHMEGPWLGDGVPWDNEFWLGCGNGSDSGAGQVEGGAEHPLDSMLEPRQWLALDLVVSGSAFMYKQVRTMAAMVASAGLVGAGSVHHRPAQGRVSASDVRALLDPACKARFQPSPAPAHGLYLRRVHFPPLEALCRTAAADDIRVGAALLRRQQVGIGAATEADRVWEHQRAAESARRIRRMLWGEGVGRGMVEAAAREQHADGALNGAAMLRVASSGAIRAGEASSSADALEAAAVAVSRLRHRVEAASASMAAVPLGMPVQLVLEADGLMRPGQPL